MTSLSAITLILIMLPLAALPSTSVALVVVKSVTSGRRHGVAATAGIVSGDLAFVAMALVGVAYLAQWLGGLFGALQLLAGLYLVWLGLTLLRASPSPVAAPQRQPASSLLMSYLAGLLITLGDVKAIFFYASLFPTLLDVTALTPWDMAAVIAITVCTVAAVKLVYVGFAGQIGRRFQQRQVARAPRTLAGSVMIGCGVYLMART